MDTTSGNRAISSFMKMTPNPFDSGKTYAINPIIMANGDLYAEKWESLKFDSDWNQLMPVVEKIQSDHALEFAIEFGVETTFDGIVEKFYRAGFYREDKPFCRHHEWQNSQALAVWYTVTKFIEWYNEKK